MILTRFLRHLPFLRAQGAGELYTYLPVTDENTSQLLKVPPKSFRNPDYGFSVGRGAFHFAPGEWTVVTERIKLNDVGSSNGMIAAAVFTFLNLKPMFVCLLR